MDRLNTEHMNTFYRYYIRFIRSNNLLWCFFFVSWAFVAAAAAGTRVVQYFSFHFISDFCLNIAIARCAEQWLGYQLNETEREFFRNEMIEEEKKIDRERGTGV